MKILFFILVMMIGLPFVSIDVFADHSEVTITPAVGSGAPGCEETANGCFMPSAVTVDVGGKIIFSNTDSAPHTFTAGTAADGSTDEFDTSMVMAGNSYEWTATVAGEIPYFCMVHPWMQGLIIVQEAEVEEDGTTESTPEPHTITVRTSSSSYDEGDTIVISGQVTTIIGSTPITLQLFTEGNLVDIVQITVAQDGTYSHTVLAEGSLWKKVGTYTVRVSYGERNIAESEFNYTPKSESIETTTNFEVDAGSSGTFDVEYTIKGGTVKDMIVDSDIFAIIVQIESTDEGVISLDLPREFIGAEKQDGKDDTFIILIGGIEVAYQESAVQSDSRVITINFENGDSDIEIIGSYFLTIGQNVEISEPTNPETPSTFVQVSIPQGSGSPGCDETNECYTPFKVTVNPGDVVMWSNDDSAAHTVTSGTSTDGPDGIFDSSLFMAGSTFSVTLDEPGEYPYFCMVHPWMIGEIIVGEGNGSTPTPVRINIKTDRNSYYLGGELKITGVVRPSNNSILLQIFSSSGDLVYNERITPSSNGSFREEIKLIGNNYRDTGTYNIKVISQSVSETTQFLMKHSISDDLPEPGTFTSTVQITPTSGSGAPGCEETANGCYYPNIARVNAGGVIIMKNTDSAPHTFTAGSPGNGPSGEFDTGLLMVNNSFRFIPEDEGVIDYFCMVHPWMIGIIVVGEGTTIPTEPQPETSIDLEISVNKKVYDLGDLVGILVEIDGISGSQKVAIDVTDPRGNTVVSRSLVFTFNNEDGEIEFRISEDFKTGTYKVTATTSDGSRTETDIAYFKIKSQFNSFKISNVNVTNQQGNPSDLEAGQIGFIKVNLESNKSIATLVTVNIFDSELTSIGIGSVKTTLSSGNSEIILSFMIPLDAASGLADIYVNAFSDWPSNEGIPLTGEFTISEFIGNGSPNPTPEPTSNSIVVTTDKASYSEGETIVITGEVKNIISDKSVSVIVKAPNGNLVSIAQVEVGADKKFSTEITAGGTLMKLEGAYIVTAQYGTVNRSAETTFEFEGDTTTTIPPNGSQQGMAITATAEQFSDTIILTGIVISDTTDVTFRVTSPSGNNVVSIGQISSVNGNFDLELKIGQMWSEGGFYTITAMQSVQQNSLYTLSVEVEVINGMVAQDTSVTESNLETGIIVSTNPNDKGFEINTVTETGSKIIKITGTTDRVSVDISITVVAPNGNIVSIDQIAPALDGNFKHTIIIEEPLWKQDGIYTVTAKQYDSSAYTTSIEVDIKDGRVV